MPYFHGKDILLSKGSSSNAAIKPKAIAVATKCKGRRLKMGACSQLFKLALCGCYAPRPILLRRSSEGSSQMSQSSAKLQLHQSPFSAPICCQKCAVTRLGEKSLRWIVLKRTAIAGIFSLAAVNACFSQQMPPFHNKISDN